MNTREKRELTYAEKQEKYLVARKNLLLMLILTVVNIVLFFTGSETMMLFSATVPFYGVVFGNIYSFYTIIMIVGYGLAAVSLIAYLVCWYFSKKRYEWMLVAFILFVIDTIAMICLYVLAQEASGFLDVLIHAWVMYYLFIGAKYGRELKNMPAVEMNVEPIAEFTEETMIQEENTYLRRADMEAKHRVFVEAEAAGYHICFRRVKRTNELVINGYVYAEVEMLVETAHELKANIDGHLVQVGFDGIMHSYIKVDGTQIAKKIRLY